MGFSPVECGIFSQDALAERGVIQHDPSIIARAIKTIYVALISFHAVENTKKKIIQPAPQNNKSVQTGLKSLLPLTRYRKIKKLIGDFTINFEGQTGSDSIQEEIRQQLVNLVWEHNDISLAHLDYIDGLLFIEEKEWRRNQKWDKKGVCVFLL